jgi:hypothetical protein
MIDLNASVGELADFLRAAKVATFAGKGHRSKVDYVRVYKYRSGKWRYEDEYFGNIVDTGMEVVWWTEFPVWSMVYRGGMFTLYHDRSREIFSFLKEALREPSTIIPARGPSQFQRGDLIYRNSIQGELENFWGTEEIFEGGVQVYWRRYQGGLIGDREYSLRSSGKC